MPNRRTTIYLDDLDRQALSLVQARYGLSFSAVIRFALRTLANQLQHDQVSPEPPRADVHRNGSWALHPFATLVTPAVPLSSTVALASASAPQREEGEILTEKPRRTQEDLRHRTKELQTIGIPGSRLLRTGQMAGRDWET